MDEAIWFISISSSNYFLIEFFYWGLLMPSNILSILIWWMTSYSISNLSLSNFSYCNWVASTCSFSFLSVNYSIFLTWIVNCWIVLSFSLIRCESWALIFLADSNSSSAILALNSKLFFSTLNYSNLLITSSFF